MMTRGGEGGKKCRKFDDVICERPLTNKFALFLFFDNNTTVCNDLLQYKNTK